MIQTPTSQGRYRNRDSVLAMLEPGAPITPQLMVFMGKLLALAMEGRDDELGGSVPGSVGSFTPCHHRPGTAISSRGAL